MKRLKFIPLLLASLMLVSCAAPIGPDTTEKPVQTQAPAGFEEGAVLSAPVYPEAIGYEDYDAKFAAREDISESYLSAVRAFCEKSAALALSDTGGKNALVSPASLFFALAMAAEGANGDTKDQLLKALGTDDTLLKSETGKLFRSLYFDNEIGSFKVYNSAWLDGRAEFDQDALNTLAESYYAECIAADFTGTAYKAQIAGWIRERTNGLLGGDPESFTVDPQTLMALINTLYYKDQWINRFDADKTAKANFHSADGSVVSFDFMNENGSGSFDRTEQFTAASLQLKNGSIRFVLPNAGITPEDILNDAAAFSSAVNGAPGGGFGEITWSIPKFDYSVELELSDTLKAMGITDAFVPETADFTGFTTSEKLFIGGVKQGSKIAVDENGIEAASYTEIAFAGSAMPTDHAEMILDRPFLYIVSVGGIPAFVGIVNQLNG